MPFPNVYEPRPKREATPLNDDEQKKLESELTKLRDEQNQRANPPPPPPPPPKKTAAPVKKDPAPAKKAAAKSRAGACQKEAKRCRCARAEGAGRAAEADQLTPRIRAEPVIKGPRRGPSGGAGSRIFRSLRTMEEFHRIRRLPPYVFEQVNRAKAAARNAGADIIDLGMGNPDLPAPQHVLDKLREVVGKPRTDRYSSSRGIPGLAQGASVLLRPPLRREAQSRHAGGRDARLQGRLRQRRAGDLGAGRHRACPNPSYPIHAFGFLMAGGVIRSVPAEANEDYFHALERAVIHSIPKPLAVVVCYPSNPTAHVATLDFYKDLVAFAKKHGLFILSDLAYAEVYFDDKTRRRRCSK